jgi:hypothetical protein
VTLTDPDVLDAGPTRRRPGIGGRGLPRWAAIALVAAGISGLVVALVIELQPWAGPPTTGLKLLTEDSGGLTWVDVDSGVRTPIAIDADAELAEPVVVGGGVVVRYATGDPELADRVVGYRDDGSTHEVGEADLVVPTTGTALWLVVDGSGGTEGGVALTTAFGDWRSRVFPTPPRMDVVGATTDGLVVVRGEFRYRELQLWDVQLGEPIRSFGLVVGIRDVRDSRALVTTGCLTSGCSSAVVDLSTGTSVEIAIPAGYTESAASVLTEDGIASVFNDRVGSSALAVGPPDDLQVLTIEGLEPARGAQALPASDGWLVVATADGDAVLWRQGADPDQLPTVALEADERVIGVSE